MLGANSVRKLALAFPAAAGSREGFFCTHFVACCQIAVGKMLGNEPENDNRPQATLSEKETTMNYTKTEVAVLGEAVRVIELLTSQRTFTRISMACDTSRSIAPLGWMTS